VPRLLLGRRVDRRSALAVIRRSLVQLPEQRRHLERGAAASVPLFPARARALHRLLLVIVVSTPKAIGTPVELAACADAVRGASAMYSKCIVSP
jgi:hypothetical protein